MVREMGDGMLLADLAVRCVDGWGVRCRMSETEGRAFEEVAEEGRRALQDEC